jgi:outer membrane receptor for monomeric catechols
VANGLIAYTRGDNKFALNIENIFDERHFTVVQARLANPGEHRGFRLTFARAF